MPAGFLWCGPSSRERCSGSLFILRRNIAA
jgi:hypothetical protein